MGGDEALRLVTTFFGVLVYVMKVKTEVEASYPLPALRYPTKKDNRSA